MFLAYKVPIFSVILISSTTFTYDLGSDSGYVLPVLIQTYLLPGLIL
jgi:hypothetical protein